MPRPFRERLEWDSERGEIHDGDVRYMMIRPDALMSVFARLEPAARKEALAAFHAAITEFGARSAANYSSTKVPLIDVVAATAPQLGWGIWSVETGAEIVTVSVENSPFAGGLSQCDTPVCTPISGMLQAVGSLMTGHSVMAQEIRCASQHGGNCRFEIRMKQQ